MEYFLELSSSGLVRGSIYALIALGYTMVYGIIQLINFAHGEIYMIGAFVALIVSGVLTIYGFSGVSFLVDKRFECENASENASAHFDLVHNPTVPYLTDSKFTPFSAPSRGRLSK